MHWKRTDGVLANQGASCADRLMGSSGARVRMDIHAFECPSRPSCLRVRSGLHVIVVPGKGM